MRIINISYYHLIGYTDIGAKLINFTHLLIKIYFINIIKWVNYRNFKLYLIILMLNNIFGWISNNQYLLFGTINDINLFIYDESLKIHQKFNV